MVIEMLKIGTFDTNLGRVLSNDHRVILDLTVIEGDDEYGYSSFNYKYNPLYKVKDILDIQFTTTDLLKDIDTVKLLDRYGVLTIDGYGIVEDYKKYLREDVFKHLDYIINPHENEVVDNTDLNLTELLVLSYLANKGLTQSIDVILFRKDDEKDKYYTKDSASMYITYNSDLKTCNATIEYYNYNYEDSNDDSKMVSVSIPEEFIKELISIEDTPDRNLRYLEYVNDKIKDNGVRLLCKD
jgi:hypothetical protein